MKVRSPVWAVVWTVRHLGIYGAYWWYQVNRELRDLGRVARSVPIWATAPAPRCSRSPSGALVIVPPFVSLYKGCQRVQAAQELAGIEERDRLNGWIAMVLVVVGFAFVVHPDRDRLRPERAQQGLAIAPRSPTTTPRRPRAASAARLPRPTPRAAACRPAVPPPPPPPRAETQPGPGRQLGAGPDPQLERLERLAALRDSGALTPEEYEAQKAKILAEL